nr:hypothetical protein [Candidatus Sigynarchaeota archaeon]
MMLYAFPIDDPLRPFTLFFEWVLAFICFELGVVFIVKYKKHRETKYKQELAYASIFLGFAILWFCFIPADYYAGNSVIRDYLTNTGFTALITGAFLFIFFTERQQKFFFKKYFFTLVYMGLWTIYIAYIFIDISVIDSLNWILVGVFGISFVLFLLDISKRMKTKRDVKVTMFRFMATFVVFACGYVLTIDVSLDLLGLRGRLVGSILLLGSFIAIALQFLRLPPFYMLDWKQQVEDIYVIDKAGVCLFQKSYTEKPKAVDDNLVTSALSSVNYILQEMTAAKTEGQSTLKKGDKNITIFTSELVNGVVISKEENYLISYNLKNFIQTFEAIYRRILMDWNGDSKVFQPAENIIDKIFSK